ncbi:MAG: class I SAM-dependent methyltransferase [Chloroflexi bacterium]|nr:class I SAM-dependent methyltransferase [Chloroflexota bacterium]
MTREVYTLGYSAATQQWLASRTAADAAAFFLPYLRPGMRLLDAGCGPGTITLGLASAVAPGEVVGLDLEPSQIEAAQRLATGQQISNVRFEVGDAYALPFPDASFDAVFANGLLGHLRDPLAALKEMRRVLRPGGIVGVSDPDSATRFWAPSTPLVEQHWALFLRYYEHNGASIYYARHQRRLLLEAGFSRSEGSAAINAAGNVEGTRRLVAMYERLRSDPHFRNTVLGQGWVDETTLDAMAVELRAWGERPDAFGGTVRCSAVGWTDGAQS